MTDKRIVLTTAASEDEAHRIAQHLVEHRLAACVNIVRGVQSVYRWRDQVETSQEWLLVIKTTAEKFPEVRDAIGRLHSYELPECVSLAVEDGSVPYLEWLADSVQMGSE